jgi:glycosidase
VSLRVPRVRSFGELAPIAMRSALVAALALVASGCHAESPATPPKRDCTRTVWWLPKRADASVSVVTSWTGWALPGTPMPGGRADGWRTVTIEPPAGEQSYAIVEDGTWSTDPSVGPEAMHDGHVVTFVDAPSCDLPAVRVDDVTTAGTTATVRATFLSAKGGAAIDPGSVTVHTRSGVTIPADVDPATGAISLSTALPVGKNVLTIAARDRAGVVADDARATAWIDDPAQQAREPFDWRDAILYQVVVDRFRDAQGAAMSAPTPLSGFAGGHLDGVRRAIESGELQALGVNTLWLSPVYQNPDGPWPGLDGRSYYGYHGYWPAQPRVVTTRQGGEAALDALVSAAHARGVRVLFDVVPNHVHVEHPYWRDHQGTAWFNHGDAPDSCVCGSASCDWGSHIQDCWFTDYLPDLQWWNPDAARQMTSDVVFWLDRFDGDGVRIDAVPMMPRGATRRIAAAARSRFDHPGHPAQRTYLLGETYVAEGDQDVLRYYLGPLGLDAEFDYPLLWTLRRALASGDASLIDVEAAFRAGVAAWGDSGAVMATVLGNHDVPRFASIANGDTSGDGFVPAPQPTDPNVYRKLAVAFGALYTLPGAPIVYYGDEVGLAGRGDPDVRRPYPDEVSLTTDQRSLRTFVRALGRLRTCARPLRRGATKTLAIDAEHWVFLREDDAGGRVIVAISREDTGGIAVALPSFGDGTWADALGGSPLQIAGGGAKLAAQPWSVRAFVAPTAPSTSCP